MSSSITNRIEIDRSVDRTSNNRKVIPTGDSLSIYESQEDQHLKQSSFEENQRPPKI